MNMKITKTCFKTGKIIYYSTGVILPISRLPKKKICNLKLHFYQALTCKIVVVYGYLHIFLQILFLDTIFFFQLLN